MADRRRSWWVLTFLVAVHTCCWMDRYVATILMEPMKRELGLSDTQLGMLTGFAFSLVYSVTALPLGRLVDRGPRQLILATLIGVWSIATMLASAATRFSHLAASRLMVAGAESGCSPCAYSLLSDSFPAKMRGRAISLYALGVPLGAALGLGLGGWISDIFGWRATYLILGAPGLFLALCAILWMREPDRGRYDAATERPQGFSLSEALSYMCANRIFIVCAVAIGALGVTTSAFNGWAATYLIRVRGMTGSEAGALVGTLAGLGGLIGSVATSFIVDRLGRRDVRWYLWLPLISGLLLLPAGQIFFKSEGVLSHLAFLTMAIAGPLYLAPLFTLCQIVLPARLRAFGSAMMLLSINLLGMGGGIFATGLMSDVFSRSGANQPLQNAILFTQSGAIVGIIVLLIGSRWIVDETRTSTSVGNGN